MRTPRPMRTPASAPKLAISTGARRVWLNSRKGALLLKFGVNCTLPFLIRVS
jgi:hypothetical protein